MGRRLDGDTLVRPARFAHFVLRVCDVEAFRANPIGVGFDADKLVERYENGDPVDELLRQGAA